MKRNEKSILDQATDMLRSDVPDAESISASAARTAQVLGIEMNNELVAGAIRGCDDVQDLLDSYRAGTLPEARALLVRAHLHECGVCQRRLREGRQNTGIDWTAPRVADKARRHPHVWGWVLALSCVLVVSAVFVYQVYWQVPPGVRAEVQSIDGSAYLIAGSGTRQLAPGAELREGDELRTAGQSHAVLRLSDGSVVEVDQRSTLGVSARGRNTTVALDQGSLIVQAAHRTSGHLYLRTRDCRIAVTGTVFSVNAGIKGSRVAVLRGSVDVAHSGVHAVLHPGDQIATSDNLTPEPLAQQFAWSSDRAEYVGILAQLASVEHRIAQIPFPQSRYSSDLLPRVPADTLLYISVPNLGDYLSQANAIFQDQLSQSPELQQWWARGHKGNTEDLNALVGKIHNVSQYLGDEIVIAASGETATLKEFNAQLDAGNSGFANGEFGKQIGAAYGRGAGIILAANLQAMMQSGLDHAPKVAAKARALESSGLGGVQYLIAEHREANGMPENHLNLQFAGTRQRVASWLASPAPIGSLDFVSPNATIAVATLSKDPATIADDIMEMASQSKGEKVDWSEIDAKLQISVRDDLMASLSGDFMVALDGPVLPTPSWKLVIEVNNPDRLETTLERLAQAVSNQSQSTKAHAVSIEPSTVGSQRYYAIRDLTTGLVKANYTFADGFMIVAPERALLMDSLQIRASGNSLARSTSFRAMLPHDQNENYSAVAYQNLSPVLTPLLSQFSGNSADAIRKLAADSKPTVICAWGKDSRIEVASDSRLFGFDFLTLGAILDSRNKSAAQIVNR